MELKVLKQSLFFDSTSFSNDTILNYTSLLADNFKSRNGNQTEINEEFIYTVLQLPLYFSNKIYTSIFTNDKCTIDNLIYFMTKLFTGTIREKISILFKLADFNDDGFIHLNDIVFLLKEMYRVKYGHNNMKELKSILKSLKMKTTINLEGFIKEITTINSDVLYLFLLFMQDANFFHEKNLNYFYKETVHKKTSPDYPSITNYDEIKEPSNQLLLIAYYVLYNVNGIKLEGIEDDDTHDELTELDEFELSLEKEISKFRNSKKVTTLSTDNLFFLKLSTCHLGRPDIVSKSSKELILITEASPSYKKPKDYETLLKMQGIRIKIFKENKKLSPHIFVLIDKLLFIKKKQKNDQTNIIAIIILNGIYTSSITEFKNQKKIYYKTVLSSFLSNNTYSLEICSKTKKKIGAIIKSINTNTAFRDINEHYIFEKNIGKGHFGEIFEGIAISNNRKIAIKKINKTHPKLSSFWELEIFTMLKGTHHDFIINCIDSFDSLTDVYLIFEYLSFGTLRSFLEKEYNTLHDEQRIKFIKQIMNAVSYLHKHGIIHRDLKPDNLLINYKNGEYILKLTDFGLGKILGPNDLTNEPYGSLAYSAPEIILGGFYSFQPDIWSLGMLIFFIYQNIDPFDNMSIHINQIKEMIIQANLQFLYIKLSNNHKIINLMKACLQKNNRPSLTLLCIDN